MFKQFELLQEGHCNIAVRSLEVALTSKCNFHCPYCGAYKGNVATANRLTLSDLISVLEKCPDLHRLKLSGGEVTLLFDDCLRICEYCKERGIELQINSNATLLNRDKIQQLKMAGLDILHVSLNFTDADSYSRYYKVRKEVFSTLLDNIRIAAEELTCVVETILFSETMYTLSQISQLIYGLGVRIHEIQYGICQDNWTTGITETGNVCDALIQLFENRPDEMSIYLSCFKLIEGSKEEKRLRPYINEGKVFITNCIDGISQFHLHDNGDLIVCDLGYPQVITNIYTSDVHLVLPDLSNSEVVQKFIRNGHNCQKRCYLGGGKDA